MITDYPIFEKRNKDNQPFRDSKYQFQQTCPSESTCHAVRHGVHSRWPHGSIRMSLSFSAQILHSWNVLPVEIKKKRHNTFLLAISNLLPAEGNSHYTYPSHSTARTAPASPWCGPRGDSARQTTDPGCGASRPETGRILPCWLRVFGGELSLD